MRIPSPTHNLPYDKVIEETSPDGTKHPLYGIRNPNTTQEEIVHLDSGNSNQSYYIPDMVLNPEGCDHDFIMTHIGKREIECSKCNYATSFILGVNASEKNGNCFVTHKGRVYKISAK